MRITAELVEKSSSFINAVKDRELDLRQNKIPVIENLAVTRDQYDTIDFSDNDLRRLDNFPTLRRLRTLLCSNNQLTSLDDDLDLKLPNLQMLVLNNNSFNDVKQLNSLSRMKNLKYVSLIDCPVSRTAHYRLKVVSLIPGLRALDFRKVTRDERRAAKKLATTSNLDGSLQDNNEETDVEEERPAKVQKVDKERIIKALANATNLAEIRQLERVLETGHIPDV